MPPFTTTSRHFASSDENVADFVMNPFDVGQIHADHQRSKVMIDGRLDGVGQEVLGHPVADGAVGGLHLAERDASVADRLVDQGTLRSTL